MPSRAHYLSLPVVATMLFTLTRASTPLLAARRATPARIPFHPSHPRSVTTPTKAMASQADQQQLGKQTPEEAWKKILTAEEVRAPTTHRVRRPPARPGRAAGAAAAGRGAAVPRPPARPPARRR